MIKKAISKFMKKWGPLTSGGIQLVVAGIVLHILLITTVSFAVKIGVPLEYASYVFFITSVLTLLAYPQLAIKIRTMLNPEAVRVESSQYLYLISLLITIAVGIEKGKNIFIPYDTWVAIGDMYMESIATAILLNVIKWKDVFCIHFPKN